MTVEHFGSTAVPGLDAKPVIADAMLPPPVTDGWDTSAEFNATLPDRRPLRRRREMVRTHTCTSSSSGGQWERRLLFRDRLRSDANLAPRYAALKHDLARRHRTTARRVRHGGNRRSSEAGLTSPFESRGHAICSIFPLRPGFQPVLY